MTFLTAKQRAKGSLNPEQAAMCGGKFIHYNFLTAMQHAQHLEKYDKANGRQGKPTIYRCEFCGGEHIGHLNNPVFTFPLLSERDERDKQIVEILKSGKAIARQGKPSVLCPGKSN